jgi:hypothetical protein
VRDLRYAVAMRSTIGVPASLFLTVVALSAAAKEPTEAALAAAGRATPLKLIDYGTDYCDGAITVETWLKALVGRHARRIDWTGGQCQLVNDMRPGIDASSWAYCAQATVTLAQPRDKDDTPTIEIYFEKPDQGRPGKAYAFRGVLETRDDGPDYIRFRKDFEAEWNERFPPGANAPRCKDE